MDVLTKIVLINWVLLITTAVLDIKYRLVPDWFGKLWSLLSVIALPIWLIFLILHWGDICQ